jgi:hypothetical protein
MDIAAVKAAIASKIREIEGLAAYDHVPDSPEIPCAVVFGPELITFDATMGRGSDDYRFGVVVLVGRTDVENGQAILNSYLLPGGPTSIKQRVEDDVDQEQGSTLDGLVDIVRVSEIRDYGDHEANGGSYLSATAIVEVTSS